MIGWTAKVWGLRNDLAMTSVPVLQLILAFVPAHLRNNVYARHAASCGVIHVTYLDRMLYVPQPRLSTIGDDEGGINHVNT